MHHITTKRTTGQDTYSQFLSFRIHCAWDIRKLNTSSSASVTNSSSVGRSKIELGDHDGLGRERLRWSHMIVITAATLFSEFYHLSTRLYSLSIHALPIFIVVMASPAIGMSHILICHQKLIRVCNLISPCQLYYSSCFINPGAMNGSAQLINHLDLEATPVTRNRHK